MLQNGNVITNRPTARPNLDEIVEAFEQAWVRDQDADVALFFPDQDHPQFGDTVLELLCVDLERRWHRGEPRTVDEYLQRFPTLLKQPDLLERLAFEEYRQRRSHDASIDPADYAARFAIANDHWPAADSTVASPGDTSCSPACTPAEVSSESLRALQVGQSFLGFQILEELGRGRFGRVFLARQAALANREVAIKVATMRWSESDRLARLQHTNIVPVYSVHQHHDLQLVCMPFLGRRTLAELLDQLRREVTTDGAPLDDTRFGWTSTSPSPLGDSLACGTEVDALQPMGFEQWVVWIGSQLAAGLEHAHQRGILHRDLKPANILLSDTGQPLILDFNLSDDVVPGGQRSLFVGGTLPYMAPEHLRAVAGQGQVDARSDLFSLGVVLFELLTGVNPYAECHAAFDASIEDLARQRSATRPALRRYRCRVSPAIESIVLRCLASQPEQRYQSASQLREDLDRHFHDLPLKYAANGSWWEPTRKWLRRHPRITSLSTAGLIACAILGVVLWMLASRSLRLAEFRALEQHRQLQNVLQRVQMPLSVPDGDQERRRKAWERARRAIQAYDLDSPNWRERPVYRYLPASARHELHNDLRELLYLVSTAILAQQDHASDAASRQAALDEAWHYTTVACALSEGDAVSAAIVDQQARIMSVRGRHEKAAALRSSLAGIDGQDAQDDYFFALRNLQDGQYAMALQRLERLQRTDPQNAQFWFMSGLCCAGLGRLSAAESSFTCCIALQPEAYPAYFQRGVTRLGLERYTAAAKDFTRVLELFPDQADVHFNRALARLNDGDVQGAIADYTTTIDLGRDDALLFLMRSKAFRLLDQSELAEQDLREGLRRQPIDVDGWIQRGLAWLPDDPQRALADFDAALRLDPLSPKALQNRAIVLAQFFDQPAKAMATLDQLVQTDPLNANAYAMRGLLRARLQDRSGALADAAAALDASDSALAHYQAACIWSQCSLIEPADAARAVQRLADAVRRDGRLRHAILEDPDLRPIVKRKDLQKVLDAADVLDTSGHPQP